MIYLFLSIFCSTAIFILFKAFQRFGVNTFSAIVINYFVATLTGLFSLERTLSINSIVNSDWLYNSLLLGLFFIVLFNLMAITTQKLGASVSSIANKMALVIPVVFALIYYDDSLTVLKVVGILLALISVYMVSLKKKAIKKGINWKIFIIPVVLFLGSGFIDTFLKFNQETHLNNNTYESKLFSACTFLTAFIIGVCILFIKKNNSLFTLKNIIAGVILGVINFGSIYFLIQTFNHAEMQSSVVFPLNNMGIVLLTSITSFAFFKEKFSTMNKLGVLLSVIAILLITYSK